MTRNLVDPIDWQRNRTEYRGRFTFNAPVEDGYEGISFTVAAIRLGDHAHIEITSGRHVYQYHAITTERGIQGRAGKLILKWNEWEVLRAILEPHENIHIAEVENPTLGQINRYAGR